MRPCFTEVHRKGSGGFSGPQGQCVWLCLGQRKLVPTYASKAALQSQHFPCPRLSHWEATATSPCPQHSHLSLSGLHLRSTTLQPALWLTLISNCVSEGSLHQATQASQFPNRPSFPFTSSLLLPLLPEPRASLALPGTQWLSRSLPRSWGPSQSHGIS